MSDELTDDGNAPEYFIDKEQVWKELDPALQQFVISREARPTAEFPARKELFDDAGDEIVEVIAKLRYPQQEVKGLRVVERIGQIVTGTVDAAQIVDVRRDPNVVSLKMARTLRPTLSNSVSEIQATRQQLQQAFPDDLQPLDGSNVIVGIIDHGCDFAHPNFRKPAAHTPGGATRVLYLWDQRGGLNETLPEGGGRSPRPYGYGREFDSDAINDALREAPPTPEDPEAPYRHLNYDVDSEHGTAVMDIAAGNGGGGGLHAPGVAPGADIIFVEESGEKSSLTGDAFGNSRRLLEAVKYVFEKARELRRPAVVNISLSVEGGPHDGSTLIEQGFDRLLETPGRAIVIAADNLRLDKIHLRRTLHPSRTRTVRVRLFEPSGQSADHRMELWYDGDRALSLTLRSPRGHKLGPFPLDSTYAIYRHGKRAAHVFHRAHDPNNGDNNLVLVFGPDMEAGVWELGLTLLEDGSCLPIEVHAWIASTRNAPIFPDALPTDFTCTLNALGCGHSTIVVGGYNQLEPTDKLDASGEGPTRDGKLKPEVSAPEREITVAKAKTTSTRTFGATSAATPHVAGLIALLMQSAPAPLFIDQIREFVINAARDEPPSPEHGWDTCYGAGRISAVAAVRALRSALPLPDALTRSLPLLAVQAASATVSAPEMSGVETAKVSLAGAIHGAALTEAGPPGDDATQAASAASQLDTKAL